MKNLFIICWFALWFGDSVVNGQSNNQNLVLNSSFEETKDTINGFIEYSTMFTDIIEIWTTPNTGTPDVITPDFEERYIIPPTPHSGSNMIGIQSGIGDLESERPFAEYIGINLTKELITNTTYYVEYYIRRSYCLAPSKNLDRIMNKNFGILFSSDEIKISNNDMIVGSPQITVDTQLLITDKEWVKISMYFTPKTKYNKLYLGQFRPDNETRTNLIGYYVIDDILVKEVTDYSTVDKEIELSVGSIIPLKNANFLTGSAELKDEKSYTLLKDLTAYLISHPSIKIRINGHTDSIGSSESNLLLSEKRAKFIAQNIIKNGVSKKRIEWKGFGEKSPIADNETVVGRLKNRRVEFEIIQQ